MATDITKGEPFLKIEQALKPYHEEQLRVQAEIDRLQQRRAEVKLSAVSAMEQFGIDKGAIRTVLAACGCW
jgi:hypothetical protein